MTIAMSTEDKIKKRKKWLLIGALFSPFLMSLLAIIPPTSYIFAVTQGIENKGILMAIKALWMAGIGTIAVFFTPIREGKALFAIFYAIVATPIGLLMIYVYLFAFVITVCSFQHCEVP